MESFEEIVCTCALNRIFGFAPKIGTGLISCFGSASEVFRASRRTIEEILGRNSRYIDMIGPEAVRSAEAELKELSRSGISFACRFGQGYPPLLKECPDAPAGLYIRSVTPPQELWTPSRSIAVIGTRDISPYGKEWCTKTVSALASAQEKPLIVSGLALGTDICAHKTALESGLPTIGVMATGPETVYPFRHRDFAERLWRTPGCALISDYPPGTAPLALHFLRRNRIIAGICDTTVLIESKIKGGGMMTSRLAFSYSRDVYALPGRIDDIRSQGCNRLIREKVADPLTSVEDLLDSLGLNSRVTARKICTRDILKLHFGDRLSQDMLNDLESVLNVIRSEKGITVEETAAAAGVDYGRAAHLTGLLETEGLICIDLLQRCFPEVKIFG